MPCHAMHTSSLVGEWTLMQESLSPFTTLSHFSFVFSMQNNIIFIILVGWYPPYLITIRKTKSMARYPFQQWTIPYHLMIFIINGTPPCEHFQVVSQTLWLTLNQFSSFFPSSPRSFHFSFTLGKWDSQWVEGNKVNPSWPLSSSGACFSLLGGHSSGAVQICLRSTFGRLISSSSKNFWSG